MNNVFVIITSIITVLSIYVGYLIFKKNKNNITNISFFVFSIFTSLWLISSLLENYVNILYFAELFLRLDFLFGLFGVFSAFIFLFNFPQKNKKFNKLIPFFLIPNIIVAFFSFSDLLLNDVSIGVNGISFSEGPFFIVYLSLLLIQIISGVINQIVQYTKVKGISKMQIKYVLIGFFFIVVLVAFNLLMQNKVSLFVFRLINFSPAILILSIFYAIIKYRLLDIRYVFRLSIVFSILLACITTLYASLTYFISSMLNINGVWLYILPSLLVVLFFEKIKFLVADLSDKILFQKSYNFSEVSSKIDEKIRYSNLNISKSFSLINKILLKTLKINDGAIYVINSEGDYLKNKSTGNKIIKTNIIEKESILVKYFNRHPGELLDYEELLSGSGYIDEKKISRKKIIQEMNIKNISLMIGIVFEKKIVGFYCFSNKVSNDYFKEDDLALIKHTAWQIGWLINNNSIYESLKRVDKEKSELISIISHQFRSPLTASRFNIENSLEEVKKNKSLKEYLEGAYQSIITIDNYLNQLLLVLEMENTGYTLKKSIIFPSEVINSVIDSESSKINDKKIKIIKNDFNDNIIFKADKNKIKTVFKIIFSNSIKYSLSKGEIIIDVSKKYLNGKESLLFSVSDNGIGIKEDDLNNIFKKFYRGENAINYSPNGFGLNLFIAKKIIEAHNGSLWFEKKADKGTIFYFSIPL